MLEGDVGGMEEEFRGVVGGEVSENEKMGGKKRGDDIKKDEYDGKNKGKSAG